MYYSVNDPYSKEMILAIQIEKTNSGNMLTGQFYGFTSCDETHLIILSKIIALKISELFIKHESSIKDIKFQ